MSSFSSTTHAVTATDEDRALKAKHAAMWASGSYPTVVDEVVHSLGRILVETVDVQAGQRVLDVAAGTGTSAIPSARRGAEVVATDLTPELLEVGRERARAEGIELAWQTVDAEALPFADASFDVVMSSIGVMFAPHHELAADELVRVCRPGGTMGVLSWTPDGFIGQLFATMKPYAPAPPPGASPAPLWGSVEHVRKLFGDRVDEFVARQQALQVDRFGTGAEFRDFFKAHYGPTIAVYRFIAGDEDKVAALDADMAALGDRFFQDGVMPWEYLIVTAKRR
ncbi:class I SAM-dependent methyltransferase [Microbacterium sulfonylureivorans]|uniref:class I SAM-dependent methyltransferase n=1 Tax=Microbacterium sulfonylureivorans TaxID=2486854 RepID=UPI000FDC5BFD|nr:class I SAM-dependent methyltransferase [Microbacterium sulfonylureivorans]